jgi:hypothetical protein
VECTDADLRARAFTRHFADAFGQPYKISTTILHLITPSGVAEQKQVSFYTRLSNAFVQQLESFLAPIIVHET